MPQRPLEELVNAQDSAMPLVHEWLKESPHVAELVPPDEGAGAEALVALQVTTRSPLGAVAYETGGILVDGGWLRVLGAESARLGRGLVSWNRLDTDAHRLEGGLLVADDAVGGFFAINGGGLPGPAGHVFYFAPDTLAWEDTERGYADWLYWALTGDLATYYETMRWTGWQAEIAAMPLDACVSVYPFLWAEGPAIEERSRSPIPAAEAWRLYVDELPSQVG